MRIHLRCQLFINVYNLDEKDLSENDTTIKAWQSEVRKYETDLIWMVEVFLNWVGRAVTLINLLIHVAFLDNIILSSTGVIKSFKLVSQPSLGKEGRIMF